MKILHVNTDNGFGGAAKVAQRLMTHQRSLGHEVEMLVGYASRGSADVRQFPFPTGTARAWIYSRLRLPISAVEQFSGMQYQLRPPSSVFLNHPAVQRADVIHFHNTHGGFLNLNTVASTSRSKPVVWTLHDEWAFTGHCACTVGCRRWKEGCGSCPDLDLYPRIRVDTTALLWKLKDRAYANAGSIAISAPSKWLLDEVSESMLKGFHRYHVPNAIDPETFHQRDKAEARAALNLPQDRFVVMFAANLGTKNVWKGVNYLQDALAQLASDVGTKPLLLIIGSDDPLPGLDLPSRCEGRVEGEAAMARYYAAADVFMLPSISENSPLTVIESLACGTPVVAFDVGGIGELVHHQKTGYLAKYRDAADLANGVRWIRGLDEHASERLATNGRRLISEGHTLELQTRAFDDVYQEAIRLQRATI